MFFAMITSDDILKIVKMKGPVLPTHIARDAKLSLLFAGAYLAELVSNKKALVSNVKIGSSPVYYVQGQEAKIEYYMKYLEQPEQVAVEKLKLNQVLDDNLLDPVTRVALRNSPDFAVPVKVNTSASIELYWKWYLLPNDAAEQIIRQKVMDKMELAKPQIETPVAQVIAPQQTISVPVPELKKEESVEKNQELQKVKRVRQKKIELPAQIKEPLQEKSKEDITLIRETVKQTPKLKEEPKVVEQPNLVVVQEKALTESHSQPEKKAIKRKAKLKLENIMQQELGQEQKVEIKTEIKQIKAEIKPEQKVIKTEMKETIKEAVKEQIEEPITKEISKPSITDVLLNKVRSNFEAKGIIISDFTIISKDKELDMVVKLPSPIGEISYFCKVKKKPLATENDLYAAMISAQQKGLPALFIATGNINKKAKDMLDSQPNLVKFISLK